MILATYPSAVTPGQQLRLLHDAEGFKIQRRGQPRTCDHYRQILETHLLAHPWTAWEHYQQAKRMGEVLAPFPGAPA